MKRSERTPMGLRGKLFMMFGGLTLAAVLLMWLFQILLLPYFHTATMQRRIAAAAEDILQAESLREMQRRTASAARTNNAEIRIFRVEGTVATTVIVSEGAPDAALTLLSDKQLNTLYESAAREGGCFSEFRIREDGFRFAVEIDRESEPRGELIDERRIFATVGKGGTGETYFLLLDAPLVPIDGTVRVLSVQLLALTVVLLLLSALFATLLSRHISAPLSYLNIAARRLPRGEYPQDYRENGYREVAELSETLAEAAIEIGKVDALQKELIANISHDLRTPLTMIIGYAEMMRDIEGESTKENMQVVIDEARRLSGMVGDLVNISRYQSGQEELVFSRFSLSAVAEELFVEYSTLLTKEGYTFSASIAPDLTVEADEKRIVQVIRNLLDNAVNYAGARREIALVLTPLEGGARCEVRDRGEGIPQEELPNIWQRYYRAGGNHERSVSGSGLGLAIVSECLKLHNARYGVESTLGKGSTFWFELKA